jgi:K+-sensing histidine kinase KdpD
VSERHRHQISAEFLADASRVLASSLDYEATVHVLRTGKPLFVPVITPEMLAAGARDEQHLAMMRAFDFSAAIVVPLTARARTLGALTLCMSESHRRYDEADPAVAQDLVQRAAIAVDNARLFRDAEQARTERGGRIALSAGPDGDVVRIHVRDTGRGIPADKLEQIFHPFVQVEAGLTRTAQGSGLGLAIARDLARGMDGDVTVESAQGEGSDFTITLPRAGGD